MSQRPSKAPSRRLLGRYEIVAEIARGGMGTVFLARLEGVGGFRRLVAVKLMHRHLATEGQFASMLLDEARLASQLHHPNAVGVIDVDNSPVGLYIVMEYVDGFALDDVLGKLNERDAETRIRIGLRVWLDSVRGLAAAHRLQNDEGQSLNIVHRDVSPQNILVGLDGAGRITDFGVARAAERITSSHPGMIKGKPCYMAPEQAQGLAKLDKRADIFALGIVLWEILAGEMLFQSEGGPAATLFRVVNDPIDAPSSVAPEASPLDAVCAKALERELEDRFTSGRAMYEEVERVARQANLLATQEEVADFMVEAFADEINTRKTRIKEHLSAIGEASTKAMQESDIYAVPALKEPARDEAATSAERPAQKGSGPWHETPEPQSALDAADPNERTGSAVEAAVTTSVNAHGASAPAAPPRWTMIALALSLVGLAMIGAAAWVLSNQRANAADEVEAAAEAERAAQAAEAAERAEAEIAEAQAQAAAAQAAQAAAEQEAAAATASAMEAESAAERLALEEAAREAEETAARARRAQLRAQMRAEAAGAGTMTESAMGSDRPAADMQPTFENNPYVR